MSISRPAKMISGPCWRNFERQSVQQLRRRKSVSAIGSLPSVKAAGWLDWSDCEALCSLSLMSSSIVDLLRMELVGFDTSQGTIRFSVDNPLPATLIRKLFKARIAENDV